jgi:Holliday junction DNA helicase RuvA
MIAKLRGIVDSSGDDWVVIDVNGVGYLVSCSTRTLGRLSSSETVSLVIDTHVREDAIQLFGFLDNGEREWFRLLLTVQGVGSKVALAILSVLSPEQLSRTIAAQDKAGLVRANGVGPKLAARILAELKDKAAFVTTITGATPATAAAISLPAGGPMEDAISALVNLGYKRLEAHGAVAQAMQVLGDAASVPALIRAGLKELGAREAAR